MKFKLILLCMTATLTMAGCKSTDSTNSAKQDTSNTTAGAELCERNTGSRLKKKC